MSETIAQDQQPHPVEAAVQPRSRRSWWRVLLYLVIFTSGGIVGTGVTLIVVRAGVLRAVHHPEEMPGRIAERMAAALSLSAEQQQQIEAILHQRQDAIQAVRREFQPQVEAELDRLDEQVSAVLDDRQREQWRERFDHLRRTWVPKLPPAD